MQNGYDLYRSKRTPLPHRMQCFLIGGGVMTCSVQELYNWPVCECIDCEFARMLEEEE